MAGDFVTQRSTISIDVGDQGELDLFIGGDLRLQTTSLLGNAARPYALRIYVAGQIDAAPKAVFMAAQIYAPNATLPQFGTDDLYGSISTANLTLGTQHLHYDRAILAAGEACAAPAPADCDNCYQCPDGLACIAKKCGACTQDSDCCEPLVCRGGTCQPL